MFASRKDPDAEKNVSGRSENQEASQPEASQQLDASLPTNMRDLAAGMEPEEEAEHVRHVTAELVEEVDQKPTLGQRLHKVIDKAFSIVASDPRAEASLVRLFGNIGLDLIPFVGPVKKFADARELYKESDPVLKEEGRRLCVIALAELSLDIGTLGGSALLPDEVITGMRTLGDYHRRLHSVTKESKSIKDPASLVAATLLYLPGMSTLVDTLLRAPDEQQTKAEPSEQPGL